MLSTHNFSRGPVCIQEVESRFWVFVLKMLTISALAVVREEWLDSDSWKVRENLYLPNWMWKRYRRQDDEDDEYDDKRNKTMRQYDRKDVMCVEFGKTFDALETAYSFG